MSKNIFKVIAPIALLVLSGLIIVLIGRGFWMLFPIHFMYDWVRWTLILSLEFFVGVALIIIFAKGRYSDWGFRKCKLSICLKAFGWALALVLVECVMIIAIYFSFYHIGAFSYMYKYLPEEYPSFAYYLMLFIVLGPITEEILFRGFLQTYLRDVKIFTVTIFRKTLSFPVIFTAFIFALLHISNFHHTDILLLAFFITYIFIHALFFGYFREKSGSLLPSIIMHSTINLFLCYLLYQLVYAFEHFYHG